MIRWGALFGAALLPVAALAYSVEFTGTPIGAQPSHLSPRSLGASQLVRQTGGSTLTKGGDQSDLAPLVSASPAPETRPLTAARPGFFLLLRSSASLGGQASHMKRQAGGPVSHLAAVSQESGLTPSGMSSRMRLSEVRSEMRDKADALLTEFGAREEGGKIIVSLPGDVLFDFDSAEIRSDAEPVLDRLAELLDAFSTAPVVIAGHTDSKGSDAYNLALSDRRAASVKAWLSEDGVAAGRMTTEGHGEAEPVAPNEHTDGSDDPEGRQKNRRVEFTILQPAP
ncbi:OmpA family protein [Paracoccus aminophilus]|uniref:OmpA/MotB domain protein n=1 Tax=Paracoccus aminophilus JCM 7686 TaxID=1367847 RepID=S5YC28_PARAH|nr:OmpA family protein [Paracoccus aminophilus]AGT08998.1 OmpA/MotB domain protein [Paracoccus aminophilus JCM 7686]